MSVEGIGDIIVPTIIRHYDDDGANCADGCTFETTLCSRYKLRRVRFCKFDIGLASDIEHRHEALSLIVSANKTYYPHSDYVLFTRAVQPEWRYSKCEKEQCVCICPYTVAKTFHGSLFYSHEGRTSCQES